MKTVYSNMAVSVLEARINDALDDCELWADLKLSEEEYRILTDKIKNKLAGKNSTKAYMRLLNTYPLCCITQIVYFVVYDYKDKFWEPWAEDLGSSIDSNQQRAIGQKVKQIFKLREKIKKDYQDYLTSILSVRNKEINRKAAD